MPTRINATASPEGVLDILSQHEIARIKDTSDSGLYELFRRCALAVLNSGSTLDNARDILQQYHDFSIHLIQTDWGISLALENAPSSAFVDGKIITGIREHLFSVLRDILFVHHDILENQRFQLDQCDGISNAVFHILRNARAFNTKQRAKMVVCWGGHAINKTEYAYTKEVGYQLGLRGMNICTGCGPGAMKGPMKGATIGHAKQRFVDGTYMGLTEPGIIAAEPPNPIVNKLIILPDIEKRLEAFVRTGHAFIVFPGGVGTAEEILYLTSILLHPDNAEIPFPLIFTGPKGSEAYFQGIHDFIGQTLGFEAQQLYKIIIDDPIHVAREAQSGANQVYDFRKVCNDAYYYNWRLAIHQDCQQAFAATHDNMAKLSLHKNQPPHQLSVSLRRAFSGIVAGNVKEDGLAAIEEHGPFILQGGPDIMTPLDTLLKNFVAQKRMKLPGDSDYTPCYRLNPHRV
jgi:predicted Rossmann-fold nucleotide-binding protein